MLAADNDPQGRAREDVGAKELGPGQLGQKSPVVEEDERPGLDVPGRQRPAGRFLQDLDGFGFDGPVFIFPDAPARP
jgi:hypothetical protein